MAERKSKVKPKRAAAVAPAPDRAPEPVVARPVGRPSTYGEDIADRICEQLLLGQSIEKVGAMEGFPSAWTIHQWKNRYEDFAKKVARAREDREETMAFQLIDFGRSVRGKALTRDQLDVLRFEADQLERALRLMRPKTVKVDAEGGPLVQQNNFVRVDARALPANARAALERVLIEAHPDLEGEL
jgi:hypothetical protein